MKQRCSTIRTNLEERTYELRCAFNLFDLDNDGKITLEELGAIFSVMGEALIRSFASLSKRQIPKRWIKTISHSTISAL